MKKEGRKDAKKVDVPLIACRPPELEHFNLFEDHMTGIDRKRRMFADVYFRNNDVYCELCETQNCEHVEYALNLSKVKKALERKGRVIGEGGKIIRKPY